MKENENVVNCKIVDFSYEKKIEKIKGPGSRRNSWQLGTEYIEVTGCNREVVSHKEATVSLQNQLNGSSVFEAEKKV